MGKDKFLKSIVVLVFLGVICGVVAVKQYFHKRKIMEKGKQTTAYITSVKMSTKPTVPEIRYFYVVNRDTLVYTYIVESIINMTKLRNLEGKTLPVIYDSVNIKSNLLLININDFN